MAGVVTNLVTIIRSRIILKSRHLSALCIWIEQNLGKPH